LEDTATVADSILEERDVDSAEAAALLVNVELLLSMDLVLPAAASSMEASAVLDTEVLLPSSEPSLSRSLDTVLLLTRGEV
jgi:hypothetical protein